MVQEQEMDKVIRIGNFDHRKLSLYGRGLAGTLVVCGVGMVSA